MIDNYNYNIYKVIYKFICLKNNTIKMYNIILNVLNLFIHIQRFF